eukprot:scaffold306225_cov27-Prasinocladus_malaysianus.AAC.2
MSYTVCIVEASAFWIPALLTSFGPIRQFHRVDIKEGLYGMSASQFISLSIVSFHPFSSIIGFGDVG